MSRHGAKLRFSVAMNTDEPARTPGHPPMLLTIREAAAVLRLGRSTVYELIARRELEVVHIGRSVRVRPEELAGFVSRLAEGQ
jgi:excisionase family DNA binding protein